jgi:hypothetical protein
VQVVGREVDCCRTEVLFEAVQLRGAGNGDDPGLLGEEPRECGLRGRHLLIVGDPPEQVDDGLVGLAGFGLSTRSDEFRVRWAAHNVKLHRTGVKRFRHPLVGELTLDFESLELPGDPGQSMLVYSTEPASPTRERLDLLASWTSTPQHLAADDVRERP